MGNKKTRYAGSLLSKDIYLVDFNIPGPHSTLFPQDKIQVIGTDAQLVHFGEEMHQSDTIVDETEVECSEITLKQFVIVSDSAFLGKTIKEAGIRDHYKCLIDRNRA